MFLTKAIFSSLTPLGRKYKMLTFSRFYLNCIVMLEMKGFLWVLEERMGKILKWSWRSHHFVGGDPPCWSISARNICMDSLVSWWRAGFKTGLFNTTAQPGGSHRTVLWGTCRLKRVHTQMWVSQNSDQMGRRRVHSEREMRNKMAC